MSKTKSFLLFLPLSMVIAGVISTLTIIITNWGCVAGLSCLVGSLVSIPVFFLLFLILSIVLPVAYFKNYFYIRTRFNQDQIVWVSFVLLFLLTGWFSTLPNISNYLFQQFPFFESPISIQMLAIIAVTFIPFIILFYAALRIFKSNRAKLLAIVSLLLILLIPWLLRLLGFGQPINSFLQIFNLPEILYRNYQADVEKKEYEEFVSEYHSTGDRFTVGTAYYEQSLEAPDYNDMIIPITITTPIAGDYFVYVRIKSQKNEGDWYDPSFEKEMLLQAGKQTIPISFGGEGLARGAIHGNGEYYIELVSVLLPNPSNDTILLDKLPIYTITQYPQVIEGYNERMLYHNINRETGWRIYTDQQYGFSFEYPFDWILESNLLSTDKADKVHVAPVDSSVGFSVSKDKLKDPAEYSYGTVSVEETKLNNYPTTLQTYTYEEGTQQKEYELHFQNDTWILRVYSSNASYELLDTILATFRFQETVQN